MVIRKIDEEKTTWFEPCHSPDHEFPTMMVLPPGLYENVCSHCGHTTTVRITGDVQRDYTIS